MKKFLVKRNPKHPWEDWRAAGRPIARVHRPFFFWLDDIERHGGRIMYEDELFALLAICEGIPGWRISPDIDALTREELAPCNF